MMWKNYDSEQGGAAAHHNVDLALALPVNDPQPLFDPQPAGNPRPQKGTLVPSNGSYSASAGDSHTANFSASSPYSSIYWYVKTPSDTSTYGTTIEIDQGDGSLTTADFTYTFPSDVSGDYQIMAYTYFSGSIAEPSYTVSVSLPSSTETTPSQTLTTTLTPSGGSFTATAGGSHTANLSVSSGWKSIYWYLKSPSESGLGTSQSSVSDSTGNSTTASYTYSFPSGVSGDYVLTAYTTLSDNTIAQPSYTVTVSTPAPLTATLTPSSGSYTATAGGTHQASFVANAAYGTVNWYLRAPGDTSEYGEYIDYTIGTESSTTASFSYALPENAVAGDWEILVLVNPQVGSSYTRSYTVTVQ